MILFYMFQGTAITLANYLCHYDTKYWHEPQTFRPERFLNSEGKFQVPKEGFAPFGIGTHQITVTYLSANEFCRIKVQIRIKIKL